MEFLLACQPAFLYFSCYLISFKNPCWAASLTLHASLWTLPPRRYLEDVEDSERQPAEGEDSAHQDEQDAGSVKNRSLTLFFISLVIGTSMVYHI